MRLLWRLGKEAIRYKGLYFVAICATFLLTAVNLAAPRVLSAMTQLVEQGAAPQAMEPIGLLTAVLIILYLFRVLFRFLSNYLAHKAAWNLVEDLRVRIYDRIQSFSMGFFHDKQTGDLMSRVVNDTSNFELLYAHIIPELITNVVTFAGVTAILFSINWKLALFTCIPIPLILASGFVFAKRVRPNFKISQNALADLNAKLQDNFSGIHEIQAFGQEETEGRRVKERASIFTKAMLHALKLSAIFHPSVEFLSSIGTVIVVGLGGFLAFRQEISLSDIVAFMLYLSLFYAPVSGLGQLLEQMQQAYAGAERVMAVLDAPVEIQNLPGAEDLGRARGAVSFEHVDFHYEAGRQVLQDVCFSCQPGEMVALVGPTGVGKTTLTQLIPRFYDPVNGTVRIDGKDVKSLTLQSLRANIAPVSQDTFLFNGTIGENIRYANPAASEEDIIAAAKAAHIHEDIMAMPNQYETQVGERGMRLSGGQKQRVAIARAIIRNAAIIILDEATASVDAETEREIQRAIGELAGSRTIIAIAHRLSTIQNADQILVLEEGKIVQRGVHETLVQQDGLYRRLQLAQEQSKTQQ